jgi:LmbE family N-acetylglucosaminyl deacetylase
MHVLLLALLAATAPPPELPGLGPSTSLLVVAPHPDDEVLCCAGVIQRVLQAHGHVTIAWVTSGDASELDLLVVEKSLFLNPAKFFLGYPDRGVLALLNDHYTTPYYSKFNGSSAVPYTAALSPGHPYTGASLEKDFDTVLDRSRPTWVLAPSPRDAHSDHEAAGILTMRAMARRGELAKVRYWIVHGGETWPLPRGYHPQLAETPSPRGKELSPSAFQLTAAEEDRKLAALKLYATQMEIMSSTLLSYVRITELFSAAPMPPPPSP